ncbi:MAG: tetratricopeptide repeat protein [Flavobacteriales bacterium]|nr:tetratricopeptide repeat protein [Flavobacteriales bacterium]
MLVKEIDVDQNVNIFDIINYDSDNALEWIIDRSVEKTVPAHESFFLIKGLIVKTSQDPKPCYLTVSTPERIVDFVIHDFPNPRVSNMYRDFDDGEVIMAVPAHCFGVYELFYSRNNPEIGIEILKKGLKEHPNDSIISEDLGYILRDEKRNEEALEAFLNAIKNEPSSEYIYAEIAEIYKEMGQAENYRKFKKLFEEKSNR